MFEITKPWELSAFEVILFFFPTVYKIILWDNDDHFFTI